MKIRSIAIFICLFALITIKANAEKTAVTDTAGYIAAPDTALVRVPLRYRDCNRRSPVLAGVLAILLPTAGQIYNKQYLKAGAIWLVATVSTIGLVGTSFDHHFHGNGATDAYAVILVADAVYSIVDGPLSAIHLNEKYHLGQKRRQFSSLQISPGLINAGIGNKYDAGFSLVLR